jgi:hypothetical protein
MSGSLLQGYYSVHGPAANLLARQFYRTTAVVRGADSGLPYMNVNRAMFETILRELLLGGTSHVIELYEAAGTGWKLARYDVVASPQLVYRTSSSTATPSLHDTICLVGIWISGAPEACPSRPFSPAPCVHINLI